MSGIEPLCHSIPHDYTGGWGKQSAAECCLQEQASESVSIAAHTDNRISVSTTNTSINSSSQSDSQYLKDLLARKDGKGKDMTNFKCKIWLLVTLSAAVLNLLIKSIKFTPTTAVPQ